MFYHKSESNVLQKAIAYPSRLSVHNLYVVGAHNFDEQDEVLQVFPNIHNLVLFEPNKKCVNKLRTLTIPNCCIQIMPVAIGNKIENVIMTITDNDGASSSIKTLDRHLEYYQTIKAIGKETVPMTTLQDTKNFIQVLPEALLIDVEGCEIEVLQGMDDLMAKNLKFVMVETCPDNLYKNVPATLPEVIHILKSFGLDHIYYEDIEPTTPNHGNSLFVK